MKTMMMKRMCCCCCSSMRMMRNEKEGRDQHIINIYKERKKYEEVNIYNSIALRAAS